ncbi:MAG: peptidase S8 [Anaerolineaceae bacterium]|nr:peptidase S8 [Anaerolineaceae bacterium]
MPNINTPELTLVRGNKQIALEKESSVFTALAPTRTELQRLQSTEGVHTVSRISGNVFKAYVNRTQRDAAMSKFRSMTKAVCHHAYKPAGAGTTRYYLSDQIITKFKSDASPANIQTLCSKFGVRPLRELPGSKNTFVLRVSGAAKKNPLKVSNIISNESAIEYSEPDLIERVTAASMPEDPGFQLQWYLNSWDSDDVIADADISIMEAWNITKGSRDIVVAVIDDGFELSHPDFAGEGKVVHPLDFIDGDNDPNPDRILGDYHGTPCAGVAIAEQNGLGVIGSGPGCAFMPVRTSFQQRDSDWWDIFHEVSQHANIISCSWGPPPVYAPLSTALSEKFAQISAAGGPRGKGCLIVFAAHNYNAPLDSPNENGFQWRQTTDPLGEFRHTNEPILNGMAAHPDVLTVSASTSLGKKAIYSNWGPEVSICAPSSNGHPLHPSHPSPGLGIWTTDNELETPGFKSGSQFTGNFGGTSSAAPLVAGVAGLILSSNPDLTAQQVRQIIQDTADKIEDSTPDPMLGHNKGTYSQTGHSEWFGYGKINASNALALSTNFTDTNVIQHDSLEARGYPRTQYNRVYLLLPQDSGPEWIQSVVSSDQWSKKLWTVGFSADDAGIGNLDNRLVIVVNPESWGGNMATWYEEHYPGVLYLPVSVTQPQNLTEYLNNSAPTEVQDLLYKSEITDLQPARTHSSTRGLPRTQYARKYLLMPQIIRRAYLQEIVNSGVMTKFRWTLGFSADDAGIGSLDDKSIIAINSHEWGPNLTQWYSINYLGCEIEKMDITTPGQLRENLLSI